MNVFNQTLIEAYEVEIGPLENGKARLRQKIDNGIPNRETFNQMPELPDSPCPSRHWRGCRTH